VHKTSI